VRAWRSRPKQAQGRKDVAIPSETIPSETMDIAVHRTDNESPSSKDVSGAQNDIAGAF